MADTYASVRTALYQGLADDGGDLDVTIDTRAQAAMAVELRGDLCRVRFELPSDLDAGSVRYAVHRAVEAVRKGNADALARKPVFEFTIDYDLTIDGKSS